MLLRNKGRRTAPETSPPPVVSSVDALQKIVQMLRDPEKLVKLGENESGAIEAYGMLCLPPTELRATLMQMCDGLMVVAGGSCVHASQYSFNYSMRGVKRVKGAWSVLIVLRRMVCQWEK